MLHLPNDSAPTGPLLADMLSATGLEGVVLAIAQALPPLAQRLAAGRLHGDPDAIVGTNDSGDKQKALDVAAHDHMIAALRAAGVRQVLSEEAEQIVALNPDGAFDVAIDPIDGSGSIGIGAPLGLLFTVLPAGPEGFLRKGRDIVAAGYASFGHSVDFGWSVGQGVHVATFDAEVGAFRIARQNLTLPAKAKTFAWNASNERHWSAPLQRWVADLRMGSDGPQGRNVNMRWLAAAVGDMHRILMQGGVFLYPADARPGYENGRLRLIYECVPMAYLAEQAGGRATNGQIDILDVVPTELHQMSAIFFGTASEIDLIHTYLSENKD
ncbi:class 1 fructose-bisphosphatase [Paracoccus indicus]|uniref:class 1 fructose-bisphosphatase n=1 Tax=Paracoccus indicus TaxID=2079229 RepID=UPI000D363289|nr:class 1 fructose-bisphosphatase [Paracoccus indicus]